MMPELSIIKHLLSYITEITIAKAQSNISGPVYISLSNGRYLLGTKNAVYSYADRYTTFKAAFKQLNIKQYPISSCLVLGYGLGSIPLMLNRLHQIQAAITGVEIDPLIIQWAKQYGYTNKVQLLKADAYEYINTGSTRFDLICLDVFIDSKVPQQFEKPEFLAALKSRLSQNGLLLFNRLCHTEALAAQTNLFFKTSFSSVFPGAIMLDTGGNRMLVYNSNEL